MNAAVVRRLTQEELRRVLASRWLAAYTLVFLAGGTVFAVLGFTNTLVGGYRGFVQATAGIAHLSLLIIPIMAMLPAIGTVVDDQESGMLEYLLAQPVTISEVYASKWLAVATGMVLTVTAGIGAAAGVGILRGMPVSFAALLFGFVAAIALTFTGVGLLLAVGMANRQRATAAAVIVWLGLVVFGTLGVLTAFIRWGTPASSLVAWAFINPVEAYRIGLLTAIDADLSLLGPIGAAIVNTIGSNGTVLASATTLVLWSIGPAVAGLMLARRHQGVRLL